MKKIIILLFIVSTIITNAQNIFTAKVLNSKDSKALIGATLLLKETSNGTITDINGFANLKNIPNGVHTIKISFIGYEDEHLSFTFPIKEKKLHTILLTPSDTEMDEIIIEATRGNRTVANLPTRTEVLTEEIDEAASMEASKIAHLITHSTGIQVQTSAAVSNGAVVRIQGLNGRYTQLLKDGFPLYGGISGSLDILQIPPLDLRQVEYIKGSASTLYGAGAIGGLINILTKKADKDETLLHINLSHIGAKDFNSFTSKRFGKWGFTNLASMHLHSPYDADNNGYTDIAQVSKFNFNPKIYYNPNEKTELYLGAIISKENRIGGSMSLINIHTSNSQYYFIDKQESSRITSQFSLKHQFSGNRTLTLKNSVSSFDRFMKIDEDLLGTSNIFGGNQMNTFSEVNYNINSEKNIINFGVNYYSKNFTEKDNLSFTSQRDQESQTIGMYINHLWDITSKFAIESGIRADNVEVESLVSKNSQSFILPKISSLYKINDALSIRLGGGMGYRMPTIFNEEAECYGYRNVQAIDFENMVAEESYGANLDFKYQTTFGSEKTLLTLNQVFFYNIIDNPIILEDSNINYLQYTQNLNSLNSQGFESQIKLTVGKFTWFLGYTYTDAYLEDLGEMFPLILTPKHSIKGDLLFVEDNKWRIGWDYEYKSEQLLSSNYKTRSLFTTGIIVERTIDNFVIFINAENFTDVRQSRYDTSFTNVTESPQFTEVWAPLDGFFLNAGIKIKL